jgi:tetratricopeptide (TPR) repeat protein
VTDAVPLLRYKYARPLAPTPGNRAEAERFFVRGVKDQRDGRLTPAVTEYLAAVQADNSFFEAHYNLGLAAFELGHLSRSLSAYEYALSIKPTHLDARFNFALALQKANYPRDAANELEKLLADYPGEARAHLTLANLFAQQLGQPAPAREHYLQVLQLEPRHPQAGAIRFWLSSHP